MRKVQNGHEMERRCFALNSLSVAKATFYCCLKKPNATNDSNDHVHRSIIVPFCTRVFFQYTSHVLIRGKSRKAYKKKERNGSNSIRGSAAPLRHQPSSQVKASKLRIKPAPHIRYLTNGEHFPHSMAVKCHALQSRQMFDL